MCNVLCSFFFSLSLPLPHLHSPVLGSDGMSVRLAACCGSLVRVWDAGTGPAAAVSLLDEYRPHGRAAVNALLQPSTPSLFPTSHHIIPTEDDPTNKPNHPTPPHRDSGSERRR